LTEEHEERRDSAVDILQRRLGTRYRSGIDDGRAAIMRVLSEELSIGRDQADEQVSRMIESGQLRYVPAVEHDIEVDRDTQHDEHTDRSTEVGGGSQTTRGTLGPDETPLAGTPIAGSGGVVMSILGVPAAAVGTGGSGAAAAMPLPTADMDDTDDTWRHGGYWDISSETAGVVPSRSRKGQVEPKGT
jgi:hypothetical protein